MKLESNKFRKIVKRFVPGFLINLITSFFYGWRGNYSSWEKALQKSSGYDAKNILDKVKDATLKVKNGTYPYERDSVVFNKIQYSFPVLCGLMWIAAQNKGRLNVLDFGGSLGSTYYQNKKFLDSLNEVHWCIVEQHNFVQVGKEQFSDKCLRFYHSIDDCLNENNSDIVLFSGVLQYLENPYEMLDYVKSKKFDYVIIDRTAFISRPDRITIQKAHPAIYKASYPCWFFNESKFISYMNSDYELITDFDSLGSTNIKSEIKGFIFKRKEPNYFNSPEKFKFDVKSIKINS